jgi:hypothetical protein
MVKLSSILPLFLIGSASAFAPASSRAFVSRPLFAEEAEAAEAAAPAAPAEPKSKGGSIVPIKEETIEFTAGLIGGAVGFAVGGPVLGAITAAAANYASKTDMEVAEIIQAVSKSSIEIYNYLATLDAKYELLNSAKTSLEETLDKVKSSDKVDPETVKKVENALASTTSKINEINEEYDLLEVSKTSLGVIGDLVEKAVKKAGELNDEYKLTDKATSAISSAVEKAKKAV